VQSFTVGFTGAQLADHFGVKADGYTRLEAIAPSPAIR
jgi:hypothetical protein